MDTSLSLHVIAKDEAKNLPVLIESVRDCVDEIYVIDTGSTDDTVEIAKKLGCHVQHFKWVNDFSAARNYSFQFGNTAYQMWLDCDDSLRNQELFKVWKREQMPLADYHLATYHYANDGKGVPTCSFLRERVVRRSLGLKWMYFLHEGLRPDTANRAPQIDIVKCWDVWHRRTSEDLAKDRGRNLKLFQGRMGQLDARMTYYAGKEHFEGGLWESSITLLNKAITMPNLEPHDRLLAFQYLGYAHMHIGNKQLEFAEAYPEEANKYKQLAAEAFHQAIGQSLDALQLDPNRAEFHCNVADAYVKCGQFAQAIPFYQAAKACLKSVGANNAGPVFNFEPLYGTYPREALAKIYGQLGMLTQAQKEAEELYHMAPSPETKGLLDELNKLAVFNVMPTQAKDCDDIVISCPAHMNAHPWDGVLYRKQFTGGSETAAIEMAENMAKLSGRKVKVYQPREGRLEHNGVEYIPVAELHDYFKVNKPYLHVAWRHSEKLTDAFTIAWCHDLMLPGGERTQNYEYVTALTPFHKRRLMTAQNIPADKIFLTSNGLNPEKFVTEDIERDPNRFVFSSSPDRGLDRAILVLDRVRDEFPDITLYIHYGWDHLDKYGLGDLRRSLEQMAAERPWIKYVGKTSQPDLIRSFKASAYCVQPADWLETSMISALEQLCSGVYQIRRAVGGCVDTLAPAVKAGMAEVLDCPSDYGVFRASDADVYAERVKIAMRERKYLRVKASAEDYAWSRVAKQWLDFRASVKF